MGMCYSLYKMIDTVSKALSTAEDSKKLFRSAVKYHKRIDKLYDRLINELSSFLKDRLFDAYRKECIEIKQD